MANQRSRRVRHAPHRLHQLGPLPFASFCLHGVGWMQGDLEEKVCATHDNSPMHTGWVRQACNHPSSSSSSTNASYYCHQSHRLLFVGNAAHLVMCKVKAYNVSLQSKPWNVPFGRVSLVLAPRKPMGMHCSLWFPWWKFTSFQHLLLIFFRGKKRGEREFVSNPRCWPKLFGQVTVPMWENYWGINGNC